MEESTIKVLTLEQTNRLRGLKLNTFNDYISARVLFLNDMLWQATIMSGQVIEKLLKAILEVHELPISQTHDVLSLYYFIGKKIKFFENNDPFNSISTEYLKVLSGLYKSRYVGDCRPRFNYVILKNKFLAELDTVFFNLYNTTPWIYKK